jgi:hypothetical protein
LADAQLARRIRKRFAAHEGAVGAQTGIKLHNYSLYYSGHLCILNSPHQAYPSMESRMR